MEPFIKHTGVVAPLDRADVDTDQIVPARFLRRVERTGFGQFLFLNWRLDEDGTPNPDFELNQPGYEGASILLAGRNFGSGSSREHAAWALIDYGFRCIIASSFADIFHKNCFDNGIAPVHLAEEQVNQLITKAKAEPGYRLTVDLESCELSDDDGLRVAFVVHNNPEVHEFRRYCLLNAFDDIAMVLQHQDKIAAFEAGRSKYGGVIGWG